MSESSHYDLIIIGSGAGGGTLAYALAKTGIKILILERGGFLPREDENWDPKAVFADNRYLPDEKWIDKEGKAFTPGNHYFVGGNTKFYGAALFRLRENDFNEIKYPDGISPAWPLKYRDFQPYYQEAESLYSVHGLRGEDPTEPHDDFPYPCPPMKHEPRMQEIFDTLKHRGLNPFHLPIGVRINEQDKEKSQCIRCSTCDGYPCLVDAKSDAHTTCINPALQHPNVELKTHTKVKRITTSQDGKHATGVICEGKERDIHYTADTVVVSCGAVNSAALLLASKSEKHPNGLANSSGHLGRHYMCHNNSAIIALSRLPNPTSFQKTIGINDYYHGADDSPFPLGHMQNLGKVKEAIIAPEAPFFAPKFTLDYVANHSVGWWITTEDLPLMDNGVTLNESGQITLTYHTSNRDLHKKLYKKLEQILKHIDCDQHIFASSHFLRQVEPIGAVAHQVGTCRFGEDPSSSVLDLNCRTHDVENLYVVDGSFFPSSGAVNPGLTIIANSIRVADHICERYNLKREKPLTVKFDSFYEIPRSEESRLPVLS